MPLFRALAKNMAPMTNADESPYAFSYLPVSLSSIYSLMEDKHAIRAGMYQIAGFPCVIGCIDCTHICIQAPSQNEQNYVNRKGYHSVNVQVICDDKG